MISEKGILYFSEMATSPKNKLWAIWETKQALLLWKKKLWQKKQNTLNKVWKKCVLHKNIQVYLIDIVGSVPDHCNKVNIKISKIHELFFVFHCMWYICLWDLVYTIYWVKEVPFSLAFLWMGAEFYTDIYLQCFV